MSDIVEHAVAIDSTQAARCWTAGTPRGVLVVAHGMGEHAGRYREPLAPLIADDWAVYSIDHRGHGAAALADGTQGDFGAGGFLGVVADLRALIDAARAAHPGLPLVLLGHSMGSMIAQAYVVDHGDTLDGLVLSGAVAVDHVPPPVDDPNAIAAVLNSPFAPARTPFDWLSRDDGAVDTYLADPLCGFSLTPESLESIRAEGARLATSVDRIPKTLPIYIFSGDHDPLHCVLGGWQPLVDRYRAEGLDVEDRLYPDGRHEMLSEVNRDEVVADLRDWLDRHYSSRSS